MRTLQEIDAELTDLRNQLESVKGTECEVHTRIVGYYRSLRNWNKGKKEEYRQREVFTLPKEYPIKNKKEASTFLYFYRETCPKCVPVREYLSKLKMQGEWIDVDTEKGMMDARRHNVLSTPTIIFLDANGNVVYVAYSVETIDKMEFPYQDIAKAS